NVNVTRFGHVTDGVFDPLESLGGSLLQARAINPAAREVVPREANVVARRQTTPLFGLGLIEAIPDDTILAGVSDGKPDGVGGKASMVIDVTLGEECVGRFGWKAQQATLLAFSADAYLNEMGITNRFFPEENAPNGKADVLATYDRVADPEDTIDPDTGKADIDHSADFMRLLAPARPAPLTANSTLGQALFSSIGCAVCHTPSMTTGVSDIAALSEKAVNLYSDLLLHDMGALGDGIVQGDAGPRDMKTPPLWGARLSAPYLHDGRAPSLDAAIRAHDGEAAASRARYIGLTAAERLQLLSFINSL
ncbi:MAG: di-heme oxidoredictase family protein, partial [Prosthecobacter sp.]|nr:di-heme oxidoredictase family protein [Prosthecobacter sp.]